MKLRVLKKGGRFFPQVKGWFFWYHIGPTELKGHEDQWEVPVGVDDQGKAVEICLQYKIRTTENKNQVVWEKEIE
jgi:hypothetical protein